jgi:hypothetical protein
MPIFVAHYPGVNRGFRRDDGKSSRLLVLIDRSLALAPSGHVVLPVGADLPHLRATALNLTVLISVTRRLGTNRCGGPADDADRDPPLSLHRCTGC